VRVAYVNCLVSKRGLLGVEKKLALQARAAVDLDLDLDIFYVGIKRLINNGGVHYHCQGRGAVSKFIASFTRYSRVHRFIDTDRYDALLLRYSGADFSLFSEFLRRVGHKTVTEHHSKELPESRTYDTTLPQKLLNLSMEHFLGPRIIRRCRGLIGVTPEITAYELERAGRPMPSCTVTNGIFVDNVPFTRCARYDGKALNLLCLANRFEPWQGLDRVLEGLASYTCRDLRLNLFVVGEASQELLELGRRASARSCINVVFFGRLSGNRLEEVISSSHIAFSSLALFRKGMEEACSLKTREFSARGIPFVLGYRDPDLSDEASFFLSVPPDNSPIAMEVVIQFAESVLNRRRVSNDMRDFARQKLDWPIKIQRTWRFMESIL
jgi:glycosyltransferase involved in cell wall biosynthesis